MSDERWLGVTVSCEAVRPMMNWHHPCENPEMQAAAITTILQQHFPQGAEEAFVGQMQYKEHQEASRVAEIRRKPAPEMTQAARRWGAFVRVTKDMEAAHQKAGLMPARFRAEKDIDFFHCRAPTKVVAEVRTVNWRESIKDRLLAQHQMRSQEKDMDEEQSL